MHHSLQHGGNPWGCMIPIRDKRIHWEVQVAGGDTGVY